MAKTFAPVRHTSLWREIKRNRVAYAYIAPFFILFAIFGLYPLISGLTISFYRWDGVGDMRWKGLDNYVRIFSDPLFLKALGNTFYIGIIAHIPILFGGICVAAILNGTYVKGNNIWKTIYFLPMVTSVVAITLVFQVMFGFNFGLINYITSLFGIPPINWLGGKGEYLKTTIIIMFAWKWMGWNMVIYLAGMQGISKDIYEAATIDGATGVTSFFRVTLPLLKPIILFTLVQSSIGMMSLFTEPFILAGNLNGGADNQGITVMMYLLNKAPKGGNIYGVASAVAYVICVIVICMSLLFQVLFRSDDEPKRRKRERRHA